jgi:hypothetical protein
VYHEDDPNKTGTLDPGALDFGYTVDNLRTLYSTGNRCYKCNTIVCDCGLIDVVRMSYAGDKTFCGDNNYEPDMEFRHFVEGSPISRLRLPTRSGSL